MVSSQKMPRLIGALFIAALIVSPALAERPQTAYIFPAGGQRGTTVDVRVGGYNLYDSAAFYMSGRGVTVPKRILRTQTVFFEGPLIPQPASQRGENYPKDYRAAVKIAADAPLGIRRWRAGTSQGVTAGRTFVVGDLPEIVEHEIDGDPVPTLVKLPVTINGRVFPREDVDIWTVDAKKGQVITCEVMAARIGSRLDSRLEVRDPHGHRIAENTDSLGIDSRLSFTASQTGRYEVRIHDVNFGGLQDYVYRLTITAGPYVTSFFPLGGRYGGKVALQLTGVNLPLKSVVVNLPRQSRSTYRHIFKTTAGPSNAIQLELGDLPESNETNSTGTKSNGTKGRTKSRVRFPAVLNGRISTAGEVDVWTFDAKKGEQLFFDLKAARLGSPLDSVLTVINAEGKQIATADDMGSGKTDSQLKLKVPVDGVYAIRITDRLTSRGGPQYSYRLRVSRAERPGVRLQLPVDALTVDRGKSATLKINVQRLGGFQGEIDLSVTGLPKGVTVTGTKIGKNAKNATLAFKAEGTATFGISRFRIKGTAILNGKKPNGQKSNGQKSNGKKSNGQKSESQKSESQKPQIITATSSVTAGELPGNQFWLSVAVPTPFKFSGEFETKYAARGSIYARRYTIDRGGFTGPISVQLADLQNRHQQGVTGPTIVLPNGTTQFDYPITLPPWMEIGRTSRSCIMIVGVVIDKNGRKHKVSYSSQAQNEQIILLIDPERLSIRCEQKSMRVRRGQTVRVNVQIERANGMAGAAKIQLVIPDHIRGLQSSTLTIPPGRTRGLLSIRFAKKEIGPFNMPLVVRVTLQDAKTGRPFTAETKLTFVKDRQTRR